MSNNAGKKARATRWHIFKVFQSINRTTRVSYSQFQALAKAETNR